MPSKAMIPAHRLAALRALQQHCREGARTLPPLTRGTASHAGEHLGSSGERSSTAAPGTSSGSGGSGAAASAPPHPPPPAHPVLQRILRTDLAAEEATAALYRGQQRVLGRRPDLAAFAEREDQHAAELRRLAPSHRMRPSLLAPALKAGFWALGAAAALAPRQVSAAVTAGVQDALTDVCNEQLRQLREEGLSEAAPQVRQAVRAMRDEAREVEGSPVVPDVLALQRWRELSPPEALAAAVKLGARTALNLAGRL